MYQHFLSAKYRGLLATLPVTFTLAFGAGAVALYSTSASAAPVSSQPLRIFVTPTPQGDVLRYVQKLADQDHSGLKLKVIQSTERLDADELLAKGDLDANLYQHVPYFNSWVAAHPYAKGHLVNVATLLVNVFGLYSAKYHSIAAIPDGATLLVPNEQTNLPRAFYILQNVGLLKLSYPSFDGSPSAVAIDEKNIVSNPKHLKFQPTETQLRAKALPDVQGSFINGDLALSSGIDPATALAVEGKQNNPYANVLTTRTELVNDPRLKLLVDYLMSDKVAKFINDNYKGFVAPDQKRLPSP